AGEVDCVESLDRSLHVDKDRVDVRDDGADQVVGLRESGRHRAGRDLLRDGGQARVYGQSEGDDALRSGVGEAAGVRDDGVEQLVDADEVRATDVPVGLLAVDRQGLQAQHDGGE